MLTEEQLQALEEPDALVCLTDVLANDDPTFFQLTFHASFAVKLFDVIRREGPNVQGFERMQQSFRESVEVIRTTLATLPEACGGLLERFREPTPVAQAALMRLIRDLAKFKNWSLDT